MSAENRHSFARTITEPGDKVVGAIESSDPHKIYEALGQHLPEGKIHLINQDPVGFVHNGTTLAVSDESWSRAEASGAPVDLFITEPLSHAIVRLGGPDKLIGAFATSQRALVESD